jgi:hypothetical protein
MIVWILLNKFFIHMRQHNLVRKFLPVVLVAIFVIAQNVILIQSASAETTTWSSGGAVDNTRGPKFNAMDCNRSSSAQLSDGSVACYGLWDYGDEFGNDSSVCGGPDPLYENKKTTGCVIPVKMCRSGKAIASSFYGKNNMPQNKIAEFAKKLQSSESAVKNQIVSLWEYKCTSQEVTGLESIIDVERIQKSYGEKNKTWNFVSSRKNMVIVGAYEGDSKNDSITVNVENVLPNTLLVLSAYDPVQWKITGKSVKNIRGIFVTGYYNQSIVGVPSGVKVESLISEAGGSPYFMVYDSAEAEYYKLQDYLYDKTGYTAQFFYGSYNPSAVTIDVSKAVSMAEITWPKKEEVKNVSVASSTIIKDVSTTQTILETNVKSIISGLQVSAEIFYDNQTSLSGDGYRGSFKGFCKSAYFKNAQKNALKYKRTLSCKDSGSQYRVSVSLDKAKEFFCADSSGLSLVTTKKISKTALACPLIN